MTDQLENPVSHRGLTNPRSEVSGLDELSLIKPEQGGCQTINLELGSAQNLECRNLSLEGLEDELLTCCQTAAQPCHKEGGVQDGSLLELSPRATPSKAACYTDYTGFASSHTGGTIFDRLVSYAADLIKLLEIRFLKMLYVRRDERIRNRAGTTPAQQPIANNGVMPPGRKKKRVLKPGAVRE